MLGDGENSLYWDGPGLFAWGAVASDFISVGGLEAATEERRRLSIWYDGRDCPGTLASVLNGQTVLLGLGGDPSQPNMTCTLFGIGVDAGVMYQYRVGIAQDLDSMVAGLRATALGRSFVVTAIVEVDAGVFTYVAESVGQSEGGGYEQFETVAVDWSEERLATGVGELGDAGYLITASASTTASSFVIVATKDPGAAVPRRSIVATATDVESYLADVASAVHEGYSPVSLLLEGSPLPDGGLGLVLIGEK